MNDPWVEKYRPKDFNNIVLDDCNKLFFNEIMNAGTIPNMLFYGPPGTGKTTTIINLIRSYQEKFAHKFTRLYIPNLFLRQVPNL
jgi:replication-associated recombination protein RarA